MNRVIYFIEDQDALTPYILLARQEDSFPGCRILASDSIDDAIEWCEKSNEDVLFVVDSRMTSELLPSYLEKALEESKINIQEVSGLVTNEKLTGTLGTVVLKSLKPDCRIILLTAFFQTISEIRQAHPVLEKLLDTSIDVALPKKDPVALTYVIQSQLVELSHARKKRQDD